MAGSFTIQPGADLLNIDLVSLFDEPSPIPFHAIAALLAIVLGGTQLYMKKGTMTHMVIGRTWVGIMLVVALSSFFISELKVWGYFSPIHLLSILTIFTLAAAVYYARVGNIKGHKRVMVMLYAFALILTGLFTLLPGRVMHQVVFG